MFKKIFVLIFRFLGYPFYWFSGFVPRNNKIWVFGSFGVFNDNSRYLYQYILNNPKNNIRSIWISDNKKSVKEASKFGEAYYLYSFKGLFYSLIAKVYVFSSYITNISFFTSRNAVKVNLWHGIPLKKIEFDITTPPLNKSFRDANILSRILRPHTHVKYDFVLSPSKFVSDYSFKSAFRVNDENILIAQYPRVTYLENMDKQSYRSKFKEFDRVFLYAPTWRDDGRDFIKESGLDFDKLNEICSNNNSVLLLKLHSATSLNIDLSKFNYIKLIENNIDPMSLLAISDCLISDYSSIYFDYLVLDKPIIHFCFDLEKYLMSREMYFNFNDVVAGIMVSDVNHLYDELEKISNGIDNGKELRSNVRNLFLSSNNLKDNEIIERISRFVELQ